jgi:PAS domain S-box-containing protein
MNSSSPQIPDRDELETYACASDEIILEFDGEGTFLKVCALNQGLLIRPKDELIGRRASEFLGEEFLSPFLDTFQRCLATGQASTMEYSLELQGVLHWFSARIVPGRSVDGKPKTVCMLARDITERKLYERRLAESENRLRAMLESEPECVKLISAEGVLLEMNAAGLRMLEADRGGQIVGRPVRDFLAPEYRDAFRSLNDAVFRGESLIVEFDIVGLKGTRLTVESHAGPLRDPEGRIVGHLAVTRDITERKRAEARLKESHNLLKSIVEQATDGIFVKDLSGHYLLANSAVAKIAGKPLEEIIGKEQGTVFPPATADQIRAHDQKAMETGKTEVFEVVLAADKPSRILCTEAPYRDSVGKTIGVIGTFHDITEYKQLEEQLLQLQKIEAIGRLAGGVAHDFNNILTIIGGYTEVALRQMPVHGPGSDCLEGIKNAANRAAGLTRQLLAFSRRQVLVSRVIDLNAVVSDTLQMLERVIGEDVELVMSMDPTLRHVMADPTQISQVILNLVVNARDAMPKGGTLTITSRNIDSREERRKTTLPQGEYVVLTIHDTGHGMDAETAKQVFEPFFTTKEMGKGVGLGLSTAYGIVKQSGGDITVESELSRGATFNIYLPSTHEKLPEEISLTAGKGAPCSETVLLVEDEEELREFIREVLANQGYKVLEARNGQQGIVVAREYSGTIDLLLTDIVMPGFNGTELADQLMMTRPKLKVLFMSGYAEPAAVDLSKLSEEGRFLPKPFSVGDLTRKLREMLD